MTHVLLRRGNWDSDMHTIRVPCVDTEKRQPFMQRERERS